MTPSNLGANPLLLPNGGKTWYQRVKYSSTIPQVDSVCLTFLQFILFLLIESTKILF